MLSPAGLTALIILVLVHEACSANDSHHLCAPSCGNIHNISYPFRLDSDPENCGDQMYNLSCENDQTVLYLYGGRYYVREINYNNYTIRVVDPGVVNDNDSFIPSYSLDEISFNSWDPYQSYRTNMAPLSDIMIFVKCEKPVNSGFHLNISACFEDGVVYSSNSSLSHSKMYRYVLFSRRAKYLGDLCQVEQISLTSWSDRYDDNFRNISCTEFHDELLFGFQLSWNRAYCGSCGYADCYLDSANNTVSCSPNESLDKLYETFARVLGGFLDKLVQWKIREIFRVPYVEENVYVPAEYFRSLLLNMVFLGGLYLATKVVLGTPCVIAFLLYKWRRRHLSMYDVVEEVLQSHNNLMPIRYSYSEIRKMTKNFKDKLGEGGYGTVFKGTLQSGRLVAVKILGKPKANGQDFINEVATIGRIHHVNIVQLIGFCAEGLERALVYEYMPNGSLKKYIFSLEVSTLLSYDKMYDIALGVAHGIEYLHRGCDMQILHFDIKPHNILLDENFTPKVSDFGLAKLYPVDDSVVSLTAARGTLGYMAPELFYKNIGGVSYKADVYSFGMLLMEMACKRKNFNALAEHSSQIYFPTWAYEQLHNGKGIEMEDAIEEEKKIVTNMIIVALWCIQMKPNDRPSMNKVIEMLEGGVECLQMPSKPFLSSLESPITDAGETSNQTFSSIHSNESSQ